MNNRTVFDSIIEDIAESAAEASQESPVFTESSQVPSVTKRDGTVLIILDNPSWLCFVPASDFDKLFRVVEYDTCEIQEEKFRGSYGGWDTYLQSYCLGHGRSCMEGGERNINLVGIYYLNLPQ